MAKSLSLSAIKTLGLQITKGQRWLQWTDSEDEWYIYEVKKPSDKVKIVGITTNFSVALEILCGVNHPDVPTPSPALTPDGV